MIVLSEEAQEYQAYLFAIRDNFYSIYAIKEAIREDKIDDVVLYWTELGNEGRMSLSKAPTKGGIFTIDEKNYMNSPEFRSLFFNIPTGEIT